MKTLQSDETCKKKSTFHYKMASIIRGKAVKLQPFESVQFSGVVEAISVFFILSDTSIIEYDMQAIFLMESLKGKYQHYRPLAVMITTWIVKKQEYNLNMFINPIMYSYKIKILHASEILQKIEHIWGIYIGHFMS